MYGETKGDFHKNDPYIAEIIDETSTPMTVIVNGIEYRFDSNFEEIDFVESEEETAEDYWFDSETESDLADAYMSLAKKSSAESTYADTEILPFLVYGTLRPNCGNYRWSLGGNTTHEENVTVNNYELVTNGRFPYALNAEGKDIIATLIYVEDAKYITVISDLDSLEGYDPTRERGNLYERVIETVINSEGKEVRAYMYVPNEYSQIDLRKTHPVIASGDWMVK